MDNISIKTGNLYDKEFSKNIYRQEIAYMFKIVRIPPKLKTFFNSLENQFHFNHFEYFQTMIIVIAFSWGKRNITTLYRHLEAAISLTAADSITFSMSAGAIIRRFCN